MRLSVARQVRMASGAPQLLHTLSLNTEQHRAVTHPQDVPLQILAGPGSGKTKVLTSRVAYLVHERHVPPAQICCVTFTNKAASEMRERLDTLIGRRQTDALVMGTFHAICARFLRRHGSRISLRSNFTICDAEESKKIISKIMKSHADDLAALPAPLKEAAVLASISKAKAKGLAARQLGREKAHLDAVQDIISRIYADYTAVLEESNSLDFDDLLIFGVNLFRKEPQTVSWCHHVLVDEFQDTNSMQYELMLCLASAHRCVTVVGDPDQSIYGWRSADVTNLTQMRSDFPSTRQILLEENYRSTGSILAASLAIVAEDKSRAAKSLRTAHPHGALPTLQPFATEQAEADFIASEIKRLIAHHGGLLGWNDFVVLLRFNALSRVVESALQKQGIPNRVLAGQKFFERLEIKDILAYLQVLDNPSYTPAFSRAVNTPPRGVGEKSISALSAHAKKLGMSSMELAERIAAGKTPDIKPAVRRKLEAFFKAITALRAMTNKGASVPDLIRRLLVLISYEDHLRRSQHDWETRWENVQELINFASQSGNGSTDPEAKPVGRGDIAAESRTHTPGQNEEVIDLVSEDEEVINLVSEDEEEDKDSMVRIADETPLRLFLQASMLSSGTEAEDENQAGEKVTISTCHSAKGLEWPVVFVPTVEKGTFPFYRSEDIEEERRLLYVACTRAQCFLYLSHSRRRMTGGEWATKDVSEFVSAVVKQNKKLFSQSPPNISAKERHETACLLGRQPESEDAVFYKIQEYNQSTSRSFDSVVPTVGQIRGPDSRIAAIASVPSASFTNAGAYFRPSASGSRPTCSDPGQFTCRPVGSHPGVNRSMQRGPCASPIPSSAPLAPKCAPRSSVADFSPITSSGSTVIPPPSLLQTTLSNDLALMKTSGTTADCTASTSQSDLGQRIKLAAGKRRLGMGRLGTGYPNKKPKSAYQT